jgi:hypothetical protein
MKKAIIGFILLFITLPCKSAIKAADFSWIHKGGSSYELTLKLFRNCAEDSFSSMQTIQISSKELGLAPIVVKLALVSSEIMRLDCFQITDNCGGLNNVSQSGNGIESFTYRTTVDFGEGALKTMRDSGGCVFTFSYTNCCRSQSISTIQAGSAFKTEAEINFCNLSLSHQSAGDNSPLYSNSPIHFSCCNKSSYFNNSLFDQDGDSLAFSIEQPIGFITFLPPFNHLTPLSLLCQTGDSSCICNQDTRTIYGFCFDPHTGDFTYTPTNCNENGILSLKITQFRKSKDQQEWLEIGSTRRELLLATTFCDKNNAPQIQDFGNMQICEGEKICFTIEASDEFFEDSLYKQVHTDTISLTWNNALPGATFTLRDPYFALQNGKTFAKREAEVCWQTKIGDGRLAPYKFNITARDKSCPINAVTSKSGEIIVFQNPQTTVQLTALNFGLWRFESIPLSMQLDKNYFYEWIVLDSTNGGVPVFKSINRVDSFLFNENGRYYIQHQLAISPELCSREILDSFIVNTNAFDPNLNQLQLSPTPMLVYPNPFHDILNIRTSQHSTLFYRLYASNGISVKEGKLEPNETIDVLKLNSGIYIIEVHSNGNLYYQKLVK